MYAKRCFVCCEDKPIGEFYKHPQMADGHLGKCKECTRKHVRDNRLKRLDQYTAYEAERFKRPDRKAQIRAITKRSRVVEPAKYTARNRLHAAVRDGKIIRPDCCDRCGSNIKVEAHHHDYSKPLDVMWLCFVCHRKEHGQLSYV